MKKLSLTLSLFVLLFSFNAHSGTSVGEKISDSVISSFNLPTYSNPDQKISLKEALKKHDKVVINIFAAWCTDCASKVPSFEQAKKTDKSNALYVALNAGDKPKKVQKFIDKNGLTGPIVIDEGKKIIKEMGVFGVPYVIVLDKTGKITYSGSKMP